MRSSVPSWRLGERTIEPRNARIAARLPRPWSRIRYTLYKEVKDIASIQFRHFIFNMLYYHIESYNCQYDCFHRHKHCLRKKGNILHVTQPCEDLCQLSVRCLVPRVSFDDTPCISHLKLSFACPPSNKAAENLAPKPEQSASWQHKLHFPAYLT